jgi:hypothetical protein
MIESAFHRLNRPRFLTHIFSCNGLPKTTGVDNTKPVKLAFRYGLCAANCLKYIVQRVAVWRYLASAKKSRRQTIVCILGLKKQAVCT